MSAFLFDKIYACSTLFTKQKKIKRDAASRGIHFAEKGAELTIFSLGNSSLGYSNCCNDYASEIGLRFERSVTHTFSLRVIN